VEQYFSLLNRVKSKNISTATKCELYKAVIHPVVTYCAETWVINELDENTNDL
jgi:hypothetical protein